MIYNDRCTLITYEKKDGFLGEEITNEVHKVVPCQRGRLSLEQQMSVFGKVNFTSFAVHLQGIHEGIEGIIYQGKKRTVVGFIYHKNSTVVVVQ